MDPTSPTVRSLRDIEAIETIPFAERCPVQSTYEILERAARQSPEATALVFLREGTADETPWTLSYTELFRKVTQTANLFHRLGLAPGEVAAYVLPNLPQTHFAIWGGEAAAIACAVNPLLDAPQIAEILNATRAKLLVTLGPFPGLDLWNKVTQVAGKVPTLRAVLRVNFGPFAKTGEEPPAAAPSGLDDGIPVLDFDEEIAREPADHRVSGRVIRPGDIASYFHTGGTTGMPKIAPHTHGNEIYMAWALMDVVRMRPGDVLLCGLPLFHVNGVLVTGLSNFLAGATVVLAGAHGYRSPGVLPNFWRIIERFRVNYFSGVPTLYTALLDRPVAGADLSSLRYAICGAAPMPPEVFRRFERLTGVKILEGYGLTEATCASSLNPPDGERRVGSIGIRLPYQQMKAAVVGADGTIERDCVTGEIGIVCIKGPSVFPGYLREGDNRRIWASEGWLNTGDLGRQDAEGYFWLTGRAKDLIIRGGHNIDPQLIEETLCLHPDVAIAAAIGQPDRYAGELPMAYVALRAGTSATAEQLLTFAREHIPERAAVPVRIVIVSQVPVTAVGKIYKPRLRQIAIEHVLTDALAEGGVVAQVTALESKQHGTEARVRLEDPAQREAATALLERFAVRFTFAES